MKILVMNSLDQRYGSTYRIRALANELMGLGYSVEVYERRMSFAIKMFDMIWKVLTSSYQVLLIQKFNPLTLFPILLGRLRGKYVIVDWDDWDTGLQKNVLFRFLTWICETVGPFFPNAISTHNSFLLQKIPAKKDSILLPQGFDPHLFRPEKESGKQVREYLGFAPHDVVFGYMCTFTFGGVLDFDEILKAWAKVKNVHARFLVIGGGELLSSYQLKAKDWGISHIYFLGEVEHSKVPYYLKSLDCGLIMMRPNIANQARVSLKVVEYLAAGIPVMGQVVGDTNKYFGAYVDSCTFDTLPASIDRFSPKVWSVGADLLNDFAWSNIILQLQKHLSKVTTCN